MKNENSKIKLVIILLICQISNLWAIKFLDYTLYSQIAKDLEPSDSDPLNSIYNYYKLNRDTLDKYNDYLYFPNNERIRLKEKAKNMLEFAYDNYMLHAYPKDELDPIHCTGRGPDHENLGNININDSLGGYMLTLVESLSTLVVVGNSTEFKRATKLVIENLDFNKDNTVQVFETSIRILGSLLTAHLVITDKNQPFGDMTIPDYNDELLNLAHDLGVRLLAAFDKNDTDIPFPRVNLKYGIPQNSYTHTCTSGAGTLSLEFGVLGHLLNDPIYESVTRKATEYIFSRRDNVTGLIGNELNIHTGDWQGKMSGLGAGIDSYYEYLLKAYVLFDNDRDLLMHEEMKHSTTAYLRRGRAECLSGEGIHPFYVNVNMNNGQLANNWIDSLQAAHAGVQVLDGDLEEAICFHALYFAIWKKFGVIPERFNWNLKLPDVFFYPLRPEFAETTYFLYRSTHNPFYLNVAKEILENIEKFCRVKCGYATVHDVMDKSLEDRMESFFVSETIKYLYLTFDIENYLNKEGEIKYIFTTEGHFLPIRSEFMSKVYDKFDSTKSLSQKKRKKLSAQCNIKSSYRNSSYFALNSHLPMKIKHFERLFDLVGVDDNIEKLLDRKSS